MLINKYHPLLNNQLNKINSKGLSYASFLSFLKDVNHTYIKFDNEINTFEHNLEDSFKELSIANKKLKQERDVTKSKLETIIDNVEGIIFETDLEGNFVFLNNAWTNYSGFSIKSSIGKSFKDFLRKNSIELNGVGAKLWNKEKMQIKFVFKHEKENDFIWFEVKAKLVTDDKGDAKGFIGTIIDITNLKTTEIELKRASETKDMFLSTMSHEIRTPLSAVIGLTDILFSEEYLPHQMENLKALKYSSEHLLGLMNDLLDFNKIKSGQLKIIEKDFSLQSFLENIRVQFSIEAQKKGIEFSIVEENNVPDIIKGDKLRLSQIIKNLLSNSLKFTEKGIIILRVINIGINSNEISLQFNVEDTGIGISKSQQKTIFDSFVQADPETSVRYGGTGLGLSISKKLLKMQGSDLFVESDLGKGATFSFIITYKLCNRLNIYNPEKIKQLPIYTPLNINVLVAEDNRVNMLILKRYFIKWQVNYTIAENGEEVLKLLSSPNNDYDCILMDLQMPILNGYETTKIIRNLTDPEKSFTPIIALTAFSPTELKKEMEHYKFNGLISKPFNPKELYTVLKSYSKELCHM